MRTVHGPAAAMQIPEAVAELDSDMADCYQGMPPQHRLQDAAEHNGASAGWLGGALDAWATDGEGARVTAGHASAAWLSGANDAFALDSERARLAAVHGFQGLEGGARQAQGPLTNDAQMGQAPAGMSAQQAAASSRLVEMRSAAPKSRRTEVGARSAAQAWDALAAMPRTEPRTAPGLWDSLRFEPAAGGQQRERERHQTLGEVLGFQLSSSDAMEGISSHPVTLAGFQLSSSDAMEGISIHPVTLAAGSDRAAELFGGDSRMNSGTRASTPYNLPLDPFGQGFGEPSSGSAMTGSSPGHVSAAARLQSGLPYFRETSSTSLLGVSPSLSLSEQGASRSRLGSLATPQDLAAFQIRQELPSLQGLAALPAQQGSFQAQQGSLSLGNLAALEAQEGHFSLEALQVQQGSLQAQQAALSLRDLAALEAQERPLTLEALQARQLLLQQEYALLEQSRQYASIGAPGQGLNGVHQGQYTNDGIRQGQQANGSGRGQYADVGAQGWNVAAPSAMDQLGLSAFVQAPEASLEDVHGQGVDSAAQSYNWLEDLQAARNQGLAPGAPTSFAQGEKGRCHSCLGS